MHADRSRSGDIIYMQQGKSLDARLITEEPELVMSHLKARRANDEQLSSVADIGGALSCELTTRAYVWDVLVSQNLYVPPAHILPPLQR